MVFVTSVNARPCSENPNSSRSWCGHGRYKFVAQYYECLIKRYLYRLNSSTPTEGLANNRTTSSIEPEVRAAILNLNLSMGVVMNPRSYCRVLSL